MVRELAIANDWLLDNAHQSWSLVTRLLNKMLLKLVSVVALVRPPNTSRSHIIAYDRPLSATSKRDFDPLVFSHQVTACPSSTSKHDSIRKSTNNFL